MHKRSLSSLLFAAVLAVPVLACAGAPGPSADDRAAHVPGVAAPAAPAAAADRTPAPPVRIAPADLDPDGAAAAEQPGSDPVAKKGDKKDKGAKTDDSKGDAKGAGAGKGPDTGVKGPAANFESFIKARDAAAGNSEKTAALFVQALCAYVTKEYETGEQMIASIMRTSDLTVDPSTLTGYKLNASTKDELGQLWKKEFIMPGYCGGTPQKDYKDGDVLNCTVSFDKEYSARLQGEGFRTPDHAKYFITNGGSPHPRPIELSLIDGRWHVKNFAGLLTGVTRPEDLK